MKKSYSLSKSRTSQRLANKKAPQDKPAAEPVVGDSLGLSQPLNDLVSPASGYNTMFRTATLVTAYADNKDKDAV